METIDDIEPGKVQVGIQNMAILDTFFFFLHRRYCFVPDCFDNSTQLIPIS